MSLVISSWRFTHVVLKGFFPCWWKKYCTSWGWLRLLCYPILYRVFFTSKRCFWLPDFWTINSFGSHQSIVLSRFSTWLRCFTSNESIRYLKSRAIWRVIDFGILNQQNICNICPSANKNKLQLIPIKKKTSLFFQVTCWTDSFFSVSFFCVNTTGELWISRISRGLGLQRVWVNSVALDALKARQISEFFLDFGDFWVECIFPCYEFIFMNL